MVQTQALPSIRLKIHDLVTIQEILVDHRKVQQLSEDPAIVWINLDSSTVGLSQQIQEKYQIRNQQI